MWLLHTAQDEYKSKYGTYATLQQLCDKGYIKEVTESETGTIFSKSGYNFKLTIVSPDTWYCVARPTEWGNAGERNFMITDKRLMYVNYKEGNTEFKEELYNEYKDKSRRYITPNWPL